MQEKLVESKENSPIRLISTRFGEITIPNEFLWEFPEGLIGFRNLCRFALINAHDSGEALFMWLHSIDKPDFALPVMNPLSVFSDYVIRQDEPEIKRLRLDDLEKPVQVLAIVTVPSGDPGGITANLAAPLILRTDNHTGWQIILEKGPYKVAQHLFSDRRDSEIESLVSVGYSSPSIRVNRDTSDRNTVHMSSSHENAADNKEKTVQRARIRLGEVVKPSD